MADSRRRGYLRQVHKSAWNLSRHHFNWVLSLATGSSVFIVTILVKGRDKAMEDLSSTLIAAGVAVAVAIGIYVVNLIRAAANIYADQLRAIEGIEKARDKAVRDCGTLKQKYEQLLASKSQSEKDREGIGQRLTEFLLAGRQMRHDIIGDSINTYPYWNERYFTWASGLEAFVAANISRGKATYIVSADDHMAIDIPGMKGPDRTERISLVQRIDAILNRLSEAAGEY
jgi:hypothetical protein